MLAFYDFQAEQRTNIHAPNVIESTFVTTKADALAWFRHRRFP
jgi:hypothetical protein